MPANKATLRLSHLGYLNWARRHDRVSKWCAQLRQAAPHAHGYLHLGSSAYQATWVANGQAQRCEVHALCCLGAAAAADCQPVSPQPAGQPTSAAGLPADAGSGSSMPHPTACPPGCSSGRPSAVPHCGTCSPQAMYTGACLEHKPGRASPQPSTMQQHTCTETPASSSCNMSVAFSCPLQPARPDAMKCAAFSAQQHGL
jgi:hypothetical protein